MYFLFKKHEHMHHSALTLPISEFFSPKKMSDVQQQIVHFYITLNVRGPNL